MSKRIGDRTAPTVPRFCDNEVSIFGQFFDHNEIANASRALLRNGTLIKCRPERKRECRAVAPLAHNKSCSSRDIVSLYTFRWWNDANVMNKWTSFYIWFKVTPSIYCFHVYWIVDIWICRTTFMILHCSRTDDKIVFYFLSGFLFFF